MQSIMLSYCIVCLVPTGYKHECSMTFFSESQAVENLFFFFEIFSFFFQQDIIIWKHLLCDLRRPPIGFPPTQKSRQQEKRRKFKPLEDDWSAQTAVSVIFFFFFFLSETNVWTCLWHKGRTEWKCDTSFRVQTPSCVAKLQKLKA